MPHHRPARLAALALAGLLATATPLAARESCALEPPTLYETLHDQVVEVAAIAVDPFRVAGRVTGRGGTGFRVAPGTIVTNYHVIADARTMAIFIDNIPFDTYVLGVDPALDIAVLGLWSDAPDAPTVTFAEKPPGIGTPVYAIGYPLGLGRSLSAGIVSGRDRVLPRTTSSWLSPFIQTDAAINPGNSGGPLVDQCGRVVGMVTASLAEPLSGQIGLAIPTPVLEPVIREIIETGKVARPWHGLYGQMVTPPILMSMGVPQQFWAENTGFLVETVEPGSAADRAGLRGGMWPILWGGSEILLGGDIITRVNGRPIDSLDDALDAVNGLEIGKKVTIDFRRNGEAMKASVTIEERPLLEQELNIYRPR